MGRAQGKVETLDGGQMGVRTKVLHSEPAFAWLPPSSHFRLHRISARQAGETSRRGKKGRAVISDRWSVVGGVWCGRGGRLL